MTDKTEYVYENAHYHIQVGQSVHNDGEFDCYQVVNKKTGVIEVENTILPTAKRAADELSTALLEFSGITLDAKPAQTLQS